jgi:hypothetical protein
MKAIFIKKQQPVEEPKQRKKIYGGNRATFFPGERLKAVISKTIERCRAMGATAPSRSTFYRRGGFMFARKINADLDKAQSGELHAKKR